MPSDPQRETGRIPTQTDLGDLSGISEMFGLGTGHGDTGTRTGTDTVGRWVAATEGDALVTADASGRLVHGRYRMIAELGVGGMGVTYRAWDTKAGIPVVVKMPRREVRQDSEAMQRFAREIDAMLAVPHEDIVPITDHGDDDGCPFVVMRFLPGGSLADYRRRDEAGNAIRNPPGMLHFWLPRVAAALDHIHARGILHRDVKPGNIFLDGFLKPYLGDFGIAKVVDESGGLVKEQTLTATKMAVGTPEYMAPELFKPRSKLDGRVDQYALAVTVYEMLSGEKPFKGDRAHIIVEHSGLPVPPLSAKVPGLPQRLCMAVEKGLAKNAADRFPSCSEFAAAVVAELAVLPPEADTVRLLCPSCKNILKLPQKAAGKTGKCPRCQAAMDVAADLGSLWLEAEERGGGLAGSKESAELLETRTDKLPGHSPWRRWIIGVGAVVAVFVAMCCGLWAGYQWGEFAKALQAQQDLRQSQAAWQEEVKKLDSAREALALENNQLKTEIAQSQSAWQEELKKLGTTRETLALENNELKTELAQSQSAWQEELKKLGTTRETLALENNDLKTELAKSYAALVSMTLPTHTLAISTLTDVQAKALAASDEVSPLYLDGLTKLSDKQAEALANYKGDLRLDGLTTLSDKQAEALATHKGHLRLGGLATLSDKQAEALANHKGDLWLGGLTTLSDKQAEALATHKGYLWLFGLTTLSEKQAEALARHQGHLGLKGLTTLSDKQAEALAKHQGGLDLGGLTTLSDKQAQSLANHKGYLVLGGLTTLSDKQAQSLANHKGYLGLGGLATLSDKQAEALVNHKDELGLGGLTTLSDKAADALSKHQGGLDLGGLTTLSDKQAEALANYKGDLFLDGLTTLSDKQAEALANHKGHLRLDGLTTLSDKAAAALRAKSDIDVPNKFSR
jgi:serine/threonine protein kinase